MTDLDTDRHASEPFSVLIPGARPQAHQSSSGYGTRLLSGAATQTTTVYELLFGF